MSDSSPTAAPDSPTTPEPILRPEARVVRADRSLAAMVLFVCTLGGMGIGFGSAMYLMRAHWGAPGALQCAGVARDAENVTWLGVRIRSYASAPREGTVVLRVFEETAAERAGVTVGDVIRTFDGKSVRGADDLVGLVQARDPGELVELGIERDGKPMTLHARLGAR